MSVFQRALLGRKPGARLQEQWLTAALQGDSQKVLGYEDPSMPGVWRRAGGGVVKVDEAEGGGHRSFMRSNSLPGPTGMSIYLHFRENECAFSEASELRTQTGVGGRQKRKPPSHRPEQFRVPVTLQIGLRCLRKPLPCQRVWFSLRSKLEPEEQSIKL